MERLVLREDYITLGQCLKACGLVEDGVEAKLAIRDGEALVNGETDLRRGRKLYEGDVVLFRGTEIHIVR